jgi:hypothetical protein
MLATIGPAVPPERTSTVPVRAEADAHLSETLETPLPNSTLSYTIQSAVAM